MKESNFAKRNLEEDAQIDAILFSIWARGQKQRTGLNASLFVLATRLIWAVSGIAELPLAIIREIPTFLYSLVIGLALAFAFDVLEVWQRAALALAIYLMIRKDPLIRFVRHLAFDIGDIFLLGRLTSRYIDRWEAVGPTSTLGEPEFMLHLFISRLLFEGDDLEELDAVSRFFFDPVVTSTERKDAIARFWVDYPLNTQYWRSIKQQI